MKRFFKGVLLAFGVLTAMVLVGAGVLYLKYDDGLFVPSEEAPAALFVHGGTLFDGTGSPPRSNPGLVIRDGLIACIGSDCEPGADARNIDATGLAILPGLIDLHVHFMAITADNAELPLPAMIWNFARFRPDVRRGLLESGVTSIRDVGGPQDLTIELKELLANGEIAGPRLFVAGPILTAPGGHPAYGGVDPNRIGFGGDFAFQSDDPDAMKREVERLASRGVDGIKTVLHGAESETGETLLPTLSTDTIEAIIETARANDLWVAVHVGPEGEAGVAAALGATTVEHGVRAGHRVDAATLHRLVNSDVVYVPTLGREPQGRLNIPTLYEAGVTIGVGTDTNNPEMAFGRSYHEELRRLVEAGMPPEAVLLAATRDAARGIGAAATLGTIEAGRYADIVLVAGEPWLDIAELRNVKAVILDGRLVVADAVAVEGS